MSMTAARRMQAIIAIACVAMRLVSYDAGRGPRAGVLSAEGVSDVGDGGLGALLRAGGVEAAREVRGRPIPLSEVRLLPPVPDPQKIICLGPNYRSHAKEAGLEAPETPTFFAKYANALAPPGAEVALPAYSEKVDYEAEVAFVIGRRCKGVPEA